MTKNEKRLHDMSMNLCHFTVYDDKPMTLKRLFIRIFKHMIDPFRKKGWFGFCENCGQFKTGLTHQIIDTDYDQDVDESGNTTNVTYPIYGQVCQKCFWDLHNPIDYYD
jgi:hypothetical protein